MSFQRSRQNISENRTLFHDKNIQQTRKSRDLPQPNNGYLRKTHR